VPRAMRLICVVLGVALVPWAAGAGSSTRPVVPPRPGPAVLYAPPAVPPLLRNANGWRAAPIMVAGAQAYVRGEYLYQDHVYDGFGADTTQGPLPPDPVPAAADVTFSGQTGDVVYPTNAKRYAYDAGDLLEFRTRVDRDRILYRVTLNTMIDPKAAAVAIGIDSAPGGRDDWGYGIGSLGHLGLDRVIVASGDGAHSHDVPGATASANAARNQIEISVPLTPPARGSWRHYVVVGLWNGSSFKTILDDPTAEEPGGAHGTNPPPIFNVGFRFAEPAVRSDLDGDLADPAGGDGVRTAGPGSWRDHAQAQALAARDISAFHADIDFGKLRARATDTSGVPRTGTLVRLYASHIERGEGMQPDRPMMRGRIQPYVLYVPRSYSARRPAPLTLELHSLAASYNQYAVFAPEIYRQLGEERGSLVLTPAGRGPDGWYHDEAELDVYEAWADVARHYAIDPDRVSVSGYSMGGYGTYKLAATYPDLFARAFAVVGPADESITGGPTGGAFAGAEDTENTIHVLDNLRNVPLLMWNGTNDELVPVAGPLQTERRLYDLGYEHRLDLFPGYDHFLFSLRDEWGPGRDWLGDHRRLRAPSHVTFRAFPEMDRPALGLTHDHAYWLSRVRVARGARSGLVDAFSATRGYLDPTMLDVIPGGTDPSAHLSFGLMPQPSALKPPPADRIVMNLTDVSALTIWPEAAGVRGRTLTLRWTTNGPVTVTLAGSFGTVSLTVPAGSATRVVRL
jgi:dienelactone hydrolase